MFENLMRSRARIVLVLLLSGACRFPDLPPVDVDGSDEADGPVSDGGANDSSIDAPGIHAFDIAYPTEWRFSVAGPVSGFVLVVNKGGTPLALSTFQVSAISDDHPSAVVRITSPITPSATLPVNNAGGALTPLSEQLIVSSGLVTEPWTARDDDLLSIEIVGAPPGTYDIACDLTISLDGVDVEPPMTIHVVPGPVVYADPLVSRRAAGFR